MDSTKCSINELLHTIVLDYKLNAEQFKNCLIWNGAAIAPHICGIIGRDKKCLSVEDSATAFSELTKFQSELPPDADVAKLLLSYIPRETDTGDESVDYRSYSLHPATYPGKYELIIINGRAKAACSRYARNLMSANSLIIIPNAEELTGKLPKDLFYAEFKNNEDGTKLVLLSSERELFLYLCLRANELYSDSFDMKLNFEYTAEADKAISAIPSIMFVHKYDAKYLSNQYSELLLSSMSYEEQKNYLLSKYSYKSDFYSFQFKQLGCRVDNLIINCEELQHSWALEREISQGIDELAFLQIKDFMPEIIFIDDIAKYDFDTIINLKKQCKFLVGEVFDLSKNYDVLAEFNLIISHNSKVLNLLSELGINTYQIPFLFDRRVSDVPAKFTNRKYPISVLVSNSSEDFEFAQAMSKMSKTHIFSIAYSEPSEQLKSLPNYYGNATASNLYKLMSNSQIVLCRDLSELSSNNTEFSPIIAGACGAMLIAEYSKAIANIFEIGEEVVCYRSYPEAIALAKYYSEYTNEAIEIANKAKKKIADEHSYYRTSETLLKVFRQVSKNQE